MLYGSAFAGAGLTAGIELNYPITTIGSLPFIASFGLLYGQHNGTGYAQNKTRQQEQVLTLTSHVLQLPILLTLLKSFGPATVSLGIGPEIMFTVASSADATFKNISPTPAPLETFDPLHIGVTATTGVSFSMGDIEFPIIFRATWDPMVSGSSRERLINYKDINNIGQYEVAFDWQFTVLFGANFSL